MLQTVLGIVFFGILLIFGVYVSAAFSEVELNKKNVLIFGILSALIIILQITFYSLVGMETTTKIYPLFSHLPVVLVLTLVYHRRLLSSVFAVMTAYLCCQISEWIGLLGMLFINEKWFFYLIRIIFLVVTGTLLLRYISPVMSSILSKPTKTLLIFSILPLIYYIFDYAATVYTDLLYGGSTFVFEFLPFTLSVVYLMFCIVYFKEYEEKNELERQNQIIQIQSAQSLKEVEAIRHSAYEMSILRHDMRHYLNNILSYVKNGNTESACDCIKQTISAVDNTAVSRFCSNELVNTVISYYKNIMESQGIHLDVTVKAEDNLPCSELEFTSVLSNGLENAIKAVSELEPEKKVITLLLKTEDKKLLLSIKNPYGKAPIMIGGMPVTDESGHGFGTQSIRYVTQKLNGNCQFTANDGIFTLRVVV